MPFRSQQQARWAHATDQPFVRRWDKQTDFSKLPKRVKRIRSRMGLKGCTCKAGPPSAAPTAAPAAAPAKGGSLGPGITRIHGNLCNVHGKYGPCDAALSKKKKPKGGKGRAAAKPKKPKLTDQQRAAARDDKKRANAADVAKRMSDADMGLSSTGSAALLAMRTGTQPDATQGPGLVTMGLAERASDGSYRMTPTGRAVVGAMEAGDYQRAVDTISRGTDTATARTGRQTAAAQRRQDTAGKRAAAQIGRDLAKNERAARMAKRQAAAAAKKPSAGVKKPTAQATPSKRAARLSARGGGNFSGGGGGSSGGGGATAAPKPPAKQIAPALHDAVTALSEGADVSAEQLQQLITNGLVMLNKDGTPVLTAAGQRAVTTKATGSPGDYLVVEDPEKPTTWHLQVRRNGTPDHGLMGGAWAALHGGYRGNKYSGPNAAQALTKLRALYASEKMPIPESKEVSFTIYKDATGADRWISVSSTAYRDRDKEIVSTKALTGAVALADASGVRGPLRFWHVPGVELGDCDYQATAQDGRFLIESGTFRSPALAAAVKSHADDYQLSIGFTHPPNEPDSHGVFTNIAIFERSLVPRGRASNPLTQLTLVTKESRMLTTEKQAELTRLLDGNGELLAGLLDRIATTDKAAQDGGVAYKDAPDLRALIREELASLLSETTEKAAPPPPMAAEGTPEEEAAESPEEEQTEMDAGEGDTADENMLTGAEITAIAQQTAQVLLDALMPHLGIGQKMDEVKSMLGGMSSGYAKKDAELAEVKETLATVQAQVADLSGAQPRIMAGGYRASQSSGTVTTDDRLKEAQPSADPRMAAFSDFLGELGLTQPAQPGV